jgi:LysM repeat protein
MNATTYQPLSLSRKTLHLLLIATLLAASLAMIARPAKAATSEQVVCASYHVVQRGENLFRIGLRYGFLWTTLAAVNGISNPARIYTGQVLCIPAKGSPAPTPALAPTFSISAVVRDQTVTILTANLPKDQQFTVRMNLYGTLGVGGEAVAVFNSGQGGAQILTFTIPASLRGQTRIAIRMDGLLGFYAFNWFWNNTTY